MTDLLIVSGSSQVRLPGSLNHAIYAARHGLRYVFDVTPGPVGSIYLHKVATLRRHLATADWLFWIDDDAFFTNLAVDIRSFLPDDPAVELVFCRSPVNPVGGWTWMSSGQFFIRNTPRMASLLEAVETTDLREVRAWWDAERYGLFTKGDQDAFVHALERDPDAFAGRYRQLPWETFNSRPYHYRERLDEHVICHFAVPDATPKLQLIREFAARMGTTAALVPPEELEPYRTFIEKSELAALLGADLPPRRGGSRPARPAPPAASPVRRLARRVRRIVRPR